MNRKIFAAIFSMVLLCSCGNGNAEEQSETASETTFTTTGLETTSEAVSEETENVTDVAEADEKVPITRDFFNDDVVFEEVMLPVKITHYFTVNNVLSNEYDAAGNIICEHTNTTYEYDYNPDGTYNGVLTYECGKLREIKRYDKGGRCVEDTYVTDTSESANSYEYEFDGEGRLIRKSEIYDGEKKSFEYTYDKEGRLYGELCNAAYYGYSRLRHEYDENIENIYYFRDGLEEEILWKILEKDENGNTIKETIDIGSINNSNYINGKLFTEYKYDSLNRLIYENHTVSDDYLYNDSNKANVYSYTYEYDGDNLKKKTTRNIHKDGTSEYWSNTETYEYFYDENGRIIKEVYIYDSEYDPNDEYPNGYTTEYFYNDGGSIISRTYHTNGTLLNETEYAIIPKIKTDIEYKNYNEVNP